MEKLRHYQVNTSANEGYICCLKLWQVLILHIYYRVFINIKKSFSSML